MKKFLTEWRDFAVRGNVIDMAVGIAVGVPFAAIVNSFVKDVLMPPIGLAIGGVDFNDFFVVLRQGNPHGPYNTIALAQKAGAVTLNYGVFINTLISFLIIATVMFFLIRTINKARKHFEKKKEEAPADTKACPYCCSDIALAATRCPNCTSRLESD